MDATTILQMMLATLLPVAACIALTVLRKRSLSKLDEKPWQVLVGVVFGLIAIFGTEFGIPYDGAMINVRDAAPIAAALFFGGPAGIIAGVIGGVERWFAVMWGVGQFTQVACTIGTILAGVIAAALRKYLFDDRMPSWGMAIAVGIVVEIIHLLLVFMTNLGEEARAFQIVQTCSTPMIICVGLSVGLCAIALALLNHKRIFALKEEYGVAQIIQTRMLIAVVVAFFVTNGFMSALQADLAQTQTASLLQLNMKDVEQDIQEASDENLLALTAKAAEAIPRAQEATDEQCIELADALDVAEVHVIDENALIVATNIPEFKDFDMRSGEQAAAFLVLKPFGDQTQFAQSYQPISYDADRWRKYAGISIEDGFVQVGYDGTSFIDDLYSQVLSSIRNRHVGQTGEFVVIDETGHVISTHETDQDQFDDLLSSIEKIESGQVFHTTIAGAENAGVYQEVEGYKIVALLPVSEAYFSRDVSVLIMSFMEVLVFALLFLVTYLVIKRVVVRSIWQVNGKLGEITEGNLDVEVDVRGSSEFSLLSEDINATVGALKNSIATVKEDLDMASEIQLGSLPEVTEEISQRSEFELAAGMHPAKEVGGDFYDFFMVDDDHIALVVADVSGKGVPAALFMMKSKTVIKMEALSGQSPSNVLRRANADLCERNENEMFTTVWLGILEISTGRLVYADAGHEKLAIYHDGEWSLPDKPNRAAALAVFEPDEYEDLPDKFHYRDCELMLETGDIIFQYTDGVTEATDAQNELFGEERMLAALKVCGSCAPSAVLDNIKDAVEVFVDEAPQFDDITMLSLKYIGSSK